MRNKILYFIGIFVLIAGILVLVVRYNPGISTDDQMVVEEPGAELDKINLTPEVTGMTLPLSKDPKDVAWALFQKYLEYNKTRNLEGVKSVVYKIAPVCAENKTRLDCEARMASAYSYGSALKKEDFVNVWTDEKQTILATDFWTEDSNDMGIIGRFRSIIFFVKDGSGNLKLLSFSPSQGGATGKGTASEAELNDRIVRWSEDNDKDGIADYNEECLGTKAGETCEKTNPKVRDTDSDGWWDGVEALMQK